VKITFLGTGTSQGVPVIACQCPVCLSQNPKDNRLRCSILVQTDTTTIIIDTGPDFRQQMLRHNTQQLDAVLYTHSHKDHVAGLDDVRAFNFKQEIDMPVYCTLPTQQALKQEFSYIFADVIYPGVPRVVLHTIDEHSVLTIGDITITTIGLMHYKMPVLGFRINNFTYITDANAIANSEIKKFIDTEYLVLNALRWEKHISHFNVEEAIEIATKTSAKYTFLTHCSHQLGLHNDVNKQLPNGISLAYDGLILNL
jgi:phosphoribosyl 1,2-cyclic phosphate phosphodiesterase